ncbi:MAG TPA: hypothetical protein VMZ26_01525 [Pyrinomonadaceae bacterium]|nr:hypothetical protein [Pyrinomonadaceae bacterium]
MPRKFALIVGILLTVSAGVIAQEAPAPSPQPTPRPAAKRRTFDQFDLSNGIRVGTSGSAPIATGAPRSGTVELVDERTYEGVRRLVEYVGKMGSEYRSKVTGQNYKPDDWQTLGALNREINAAYRITEMFREGLLDQTPLKDPLNILLLEESQATLREAGNLATVSGGWAKNETMLAKMAIKYNAEQLADTENARQLSGAENTRRAVLIAMLARLNANFAQLMSQIDVKKQ